MTSLCMLDTDTCAFILRRPSQALLDRIQTVPLERQVVSMATLADLLYGVQISSRKKENRAAVDVLTRHLSVIDWSRTDGVQRSHG